MSARYLIRLDDACETMDHPRWARVEQVLDRHQVKPIVAVVADNQDRALAIGERDPGFWDRVRGWVAKGWTVGMHGYTHVMHPTQRRLLVPFYARSEFAGLSLSEQSAKIRSAWQVFMRQRVVPEVWVAPAHSFDAVTLQALHAETSIRVVSDGIAWDTYFEHGFHWIPQQMWAFAERKTGLWTVCLHPNAMTEAAIAALGDSVLPRFRDRLGSVAQVRLHGRRKSLRGRLYHHYFWWRWRRRAQGGATPTATA